jgi:hypothetical protein
VDASLPHGLRRRRPAAAVLLLGLLAVACGGHSSSSSTSSRTSHGPGKATVNPHYGAPGAKIQFVYPTQGTTVKLPLKVRVSITGFKLDPSSLDKAPKRGHGIIEFTMDGGKYDKPRYAGASGTLAARLGVAGKYSPAVTPEITYAGLPSGRHVIVAALANNDLSQTGVSARVAFTVG